jgi:hypothetical protein
MAVSWAIDLDTAKIGTDLDIVNMKVDTAQIGVRMRT